MQDRTCEGVDDDTKEKLHTNDVHDEENADIIDPSDVISSTLTVGITWSEQDISD